MPTALSTHTSMLNEKAMMNQEVKEANELIGEG